MNFEKSKRKNLHIEIAKFQADRIKAHQEKKVLLKLEELLTSEFNGVLKSINKLGSFSNNIASRK